MNFTVIKEGEMTVVTVNLPRLQKDKETRSDLNHTVLKEKHVRDYLKKSNIQVGECLRKDNLDNMGERLTSIWIFMPSAKKILDKTPKSVVSSNRAKRTKPGSEPKDE